MIGATSPLSPCSHVATAGGEVSSGTLGGQFSERPFDLHRYRVLFPDRWAAFLHSHFRDHIHVAFIFGVSERAARNWWEGTTAPRAEFALAACKHIPGAAEFLMEAA